MTNTAIGLLSNSVVAHYAKAGCRNKQWPRHKKEPQQDDQREHFMYRSLGYRRNITEK